MKIKYVGIFVDDQDKALKFYEKLGFVKKSDVRAEQYRWLTVVSSDDKDGAELILEPNSNSAAKEYQKAILEQGIPATSFVVSDVQDEYERLKKLDVKFRTLPTEVMKGVTIAIFEDTVGNLIQIQNK